MSAGGLSYSGITNFGKVTLPSVETWSTDNNILQDPPSSIHTRRIDKVGETSDITTMIDQSSDRACEAINVYARGTNPSVSVSFGNYGSNGGGLTGSLPGLNNRGQAYNPFTIMKDGAFRPPIVAPELLQPLSRQPRVWTSAATKPGFVNYAKRLKEMKEGCKMREIKDETIKGEVRPTFTENKYVGDIGTQNVKNNIQDIHNITVDPVISLPNSVIQNNTNQKSNIIEDILHTMAETNKNNPQVFLDNTVKNTENYINHDGLVGEYFTNNNQNIYSNDHTQLQTERFLQDPLNKEAETILTGTGDNTSTIIMDTDRFLQDTNAIDVVSNQVATGEYKANTAMDSKRFLQKNLNAFAKSNVSSNIRSDEERSVKHTSSYLQSRNLTEATTNMNSNCNTTCINDVADLGVVRTQKVLVVNKEGDVVRTGGQNYIHDDIELEKNLPNYEFSANKTQTKLQMNLHPDKLRHLNKKADAKNGIVNKSGITGTNIISRNVNLRDTINAGEFVPNHSKPTQNKIISENNIILENNKRLIEQEAGNYNNRFESGLKRF